MKKVKFKSIVIYDLIKKEGLNKHFNQELMLLQAQKITLENHVS